MCALVTLGTVTKGPSWEQGDVRRKSNGDMLIIGHQARRDASKVHSADEEFILSYWRKTRVINICQLDTVY